MQPSDLIPIGITGLMIVAAALAGICLAMRQHVRRLNQELRGEIERNRHLSRRLDEYEHHDAARKTISDVLEEPRVTIGVRRFPLRQRKRAWGYVYLMCINDEYHKIGYAQNVRHRLGEMQVASPYKIEIVHMIGCYHASRLEVILQNRFADKWVTGEWFKLDANDIATIQLIETPVRIADLDRLEGIEES